MIAKVQVWIHRTGPEGLQVLLLRTTPERKSQWQPVTGSVNSGEALEIAALREAEEETALDFLPASLRPLGLEYVFDGRWGRARETVFAIKSNPSGPQDPVLDPAEHVDYRWVKAQEALKLLPAFDTQRESLKRLIELHSIDR
jgi:dATP pyrophosphohydrolase